MRSNQTQSTPRRNAEYAENTREWQKHATVFFQTDSNVALTYLFSRLRGYPCPLRFFLRDLCVSLLPHLAKRLHYLQFTMSAWIVSY